jgi:excisionase family DNA binding protein
MTENTEARIRVALAQLGDAIADALRESKEHDEVERLLDIDTAARMLSLGRTKVYSELQAGRLRSVRAGRRRLIPASAIADYAERGDAV